MHSPITATEYTQATNLGRNSFDEDTPSLCSSYHVPPFSPVVGSHPSPYRASTAAAFADINRALDVRSLRNSVYTNFQTTQAPPQVMTNPRPSLKTLSPPIRRANSSAVANRTDPPRMRSHSLPDHPQRETSSESGSERLADGESDEMPTVRTSHTSCAAPRGGIKILTKNRVMYPILESGKNRHLGRKDAHKSARSRATDDVVISQNGKRSSKRTRATTCLIM